MPIEDIASGIKLLVLDVDGVLTDGGLFYGPDGGISKRFNVKDGFGMKMAQAAGLDLAVISGLDHPSVSVRMRELGVAEYHPGHLRKWPVLEEIMASRGLTPTEVAYLGDDWVDASIMRRVGLPMAVADAEERIREMALWVSRRPGGQGAVREAIHFLLAARGQLDELWAAWCAK